MIYIVTALSCEAEPLIERFHLRAKAEGRNRIHEGDGLCLAVAGIGAEKAAAAVRSLLASSDPPPRRLVNFGMCGANPCHPIGELLLIDRLRDLKSGRTHLPFIPPHCVLKRAGLVTADSPADQGLAERLGAEVVDMEAAAIFSVCPSDMEILCLKIVSDHLQPRVPPREFVLQLVRSQLESIAAAILGPPAAGARHN